MITYNDCENIWEKLCDNESKTIFNARFQYAFDKDWSGFLENIQKNEAKHYKLGHFGEFLAANPGKKLVIYGMGMYGRYTFSLLKRSGVHVYGFGDRSAIPGGGYGGIPLLTDEEIESMRDEIILVVGSKKYALEIYSKLICMHIASKHIYLPAYGYIDVPCGQQYFDFFRPGCKEVFVDAGVYDGKSSVDFVKWCQTPQSRIYLFEANPKRENHIRKTLEYNGIINYELHLKGLSDDAGKASFNQNESGSRISGQGADEIETTSIDIALKGKRVTFIKMDIEGSEKAALIGAQETIKAYKPKLAISIYHKYDDFIEIPKVVLNIEPTYQLAMRHYSSTPQESVLYAW